MLKVKNLQVHFGPVIAVQDLSLQVAAGEIVALVGANGAGKSSVLNAVAGLVPSKNGDIKINDLNVLRLTAAQRVRESHLALVVEGRGVFAEMSVLENLELGAYVRPERQKGEKARAALERVFELFPRLAERLAQNAGSLSGGEQQMLVIGRALMTDPRVLLLDEPSLGLAPRVVGEISVALKKQSEENGIAILVAEQNATLGLDLAQRGYVLANGKLVLSGDTAELKRNERLSDLYFSQSTDVAPVV